MWCSYPEKMSSLLWLCLPSALWPVLSRIDRCVHKIHNILFHKRWTVTHTKASRLHIALYTAEECNLHSCRVHLKFMSIHLQSSTKGHEYKIFHHTSPLSSFNEDLMPERQTFRASDTIKWTLQKCKLHSSTSTFQIKLHSIWVCTRGRFGTGSC